MVKTVLFMDNVPSFLDIYSRLLEEAGYHVLKAGTIDEAKRLLASARIHLAILDIRMADDNDLNDISGLAFAQAEEYRELPKIILTAFSKEHSEQLLDALGLGPGSQGTRLIHLLNYLSKDDAHTSLIPVVNAIFAGRIGIDWGLTIRSAGLSFFSLAGLLEPDLAPESLAYRAGELEDLFRKLFYGYEQVTLGRLLLQRETRAFIEVSAYPKEGSTRQFVVHCGRPEAVRAEGECSRRFAPQTGPGFLHREHAAETLHCAATAYGLSGADLEEANSLATAYERSPVEDTSAALDRFLRGTLASWHHHGQFREEKKPLPVCWQEWLRERGVELPAENVQDRIKGIARESLAAGLGQVDYGPTALVLHFSDGSSRTLPNPLDVCQGKRVLAGLPVRCGPVHGRPEPSAILLGPDGQSWLLDSAWAGLGPQVRDFAVLENAIKFDLLESVRPAEWLQLEQRLQSRGEHSAAAPEEDLPPTLEKAARAVERVRAQATSLGDDPRLHLQALICEALERIGRYDPNVRHTRRELRPLAHALISAATVAEILAGPLQSKSPPADLPEQALVSLWLDKDNREVWVEGRCVPLTDQECKVLSFLYARAGRLCRWRAIVEEALGEEYEGPDQAKTRLSATVSRLRNKIENDPAKPRYLQTARGAGYKLVLEM